MDKILSKSDRNWIKFDYKEIWIQFEFDFRKFVLNQFGSELEKSDIQSDSLNLFKTQNQPNNSFLEILKRVRGLSIGLWEDFFLFLGWIFWIKIERIIGSN